MATFAIGNEEMVPRMEKAIAALKEIRETRVGDEEKTRLTNKIEGLEVVLEAHRERFQNMKKKEDVLALAAMIEIGTDEKHAQGVNLAQGYLMEYYGE
jgi:hypothetical protein